MANEVNVLVRLDEDEQQVVQELQKELGVESPDEVIHMLVQQAYQRALVVCPTCGHAARQTAEDVVQCDSCMSIITLSEGIWRVVTMPGGHFTRAGE
ncbi:MAG TPA: hypothetical protein EYH31_11995 [Anaerolineae bacterium]|nr:hypothetical protein [Anaerolineae bacterium]